MVMDAICYMASICLLVTGFAALLMPSAFTSVELVGIAFGCLAGAVVGAALPMIDATTRR